MGCPQGLAGWRPGMTILAVFSAMLFGILAAGVMSGAL